MSLPQRFLDEIRSRLTLSEIIGRRIKVTRAGRESKACCPFHHEKTPSFTINDDKQFFHCFGCGAHGDVIGFVMRYDNLSFPETIEMLAAEAGLQVPQQTPQEIKKAEKQKDLYALMEDATTFYEENLYAPRNQDALNYLLGRGLTRETISAFRIGFAPEDGQALRKRLAEKGYTDKDMITAGVAKESEKRGQPYDFFRDRVIFPVPDRRGRTVAFGGRILPDHLRPPQRGDFKPPKYINSSETPLFHKGSMLYGEPHARRAAADGDVLVVVEGYLDVIACVQAGIKGALAPLGTALTDEQILTLWKMIPADMKVPVLCFDGDNAGRKAAARVCENILPLLKPGCSVNYAFMPEGEDPDSLIKQHGVNAFRQAIDGSMPLFEFLWNNHTAGRQFSTPESRAGVIQAIEAQVARIEDRNVQTHYRTLLRQKISERFFARPEPYSSRKGAPKAVGAGSGLALRRPSSQVQHIYPRVLLAGLINHPVIFGDVEEIIGNEHFEDSDLERLRLEIVNILTQEEFPEREKLIEKLRNSHLNQVIDDILNESVYVHASFCAPSANTGDVLRLLARKYRAAGSGHTTMPTRKKKTNCAVWWRQMGRRH